MRRVPSWDKYFMDLAFKAATRSKDPVTQVGAVLINDAQDIVATGFNGFAPGVDETNERWLRPEKYQRVVHAEMNAICRAARAGRRTDGSVLYVTCHPCPTCARHLGVSGVREVVYGPIPTHHNEWVHEARDRLDEAGVKHRLFTGDQ